MAGRSGRNGDAQKGYYAGYASKAVSNRKVRQERHNKNHPNDSQGGSSSYRKTTPKEVSGWLTARVDSLLTPVQLNPITVKDSNGKKETRIPDCAEHLKDMNKADRKNFAQLYARMRKLHKHNDSYGKPKQTNK